MLKKHTRNIIYITVGIIVLFLLYALKNTHYFLRSFGFVFSIFLFFAANYFFKLNFKLHHHIILILIAVTGIMLSPLYFLYPAYDKILHLIDPILIGILVFFLINKLKTKFSIKLLLTFSVVVCFLGIFEIIEYLLDILWDIKAQGVYIRDSTGISKLRLIMDKNDDTMIDLILGTIGSLIFVLSKTMIYYYKKSCIKLKNR